MRPEQLDQLLFAKLPAIYQIRDAEQGGHSLRALLRVIAEQVGHSQEDIQQLYANWFVETCEPWVVPYIGELVGIQTTQGLIEHPEVHADRSRQREQLMFPRREVAKAVNYHRRKGTLSVLEDLANDIANWPARAVEFHTNVARFASVREQDPVSGRFADLRGHQLMAHVGTPFDTLTRIPDVRPIEPIADQPRFNPQNVGLYIWRMRARSLTRALCKCGCTIKIDKDDAKQLTFYFLNPLGILTQCVTSPLRETEATHIAEETNVPDPISVLDLRNTDEPTAGNLPTAARKFYGRGKSLAVYLPASTGAEGLVPASSVIPWDLSGCLAKAGCECDHKPDQKEPCPCQEARAALWEAIGKGANSRDLVALDPALGICAIKGKYRPVYATYHYAAPGDLGGGEYRRQFGTESNSPNWVKRIRSDQFPLPATSCSPPEVDLEKLLNVARGQPRAASTTNASAAFVMIVEFCDSGTYRVPMDLANNVELAKGEVLVIRSASGCRPVLILEPAACSPCAFIRLAANSAFVLDGIVIDGGGLTILEPTPQMPAADKEPLVRVTDCCGSTVSTSPEFDRARVVIRNSTLRPDRIQRCSELANLLLERPDTCVVIESSIVGRIATSFDKAAAAQQAPCELIVRDSIIDGLNGLPTGTAISGATTINFTAERSTVLGQVYVREIPLARDSLFRDPISVTRRQSGGMRYCYVPSTPGGASIWQTPAQYYCQPSREQSRSSDSNKPCGNATTGELEPCDLETVVHEQRTPLDSIVPDFTSLMYGDPGYCQLTASCPPEIRRGAEDESEMGVFHDLYEPQREVNLKARLEEFVPVSMNLGLIYVN